MTRISLKEAYDNRDVIAQIAKINDVIEDLPNPDLTNVVLKTGNQVIDGVKTFNDQIVAAGGVDFSGDLEVQGDLQVDGDIIQVGAAYETHAQQIYTTNDYIVTRDGAVSGIPAGQYSGIHVEKYNGVDDVRMAVDNSGIMRVGDINDEKPLAVRDEAADMTSGALVKWDGVNQKMITSSANVGSDLKPIKIVDGAPAVIANDLVSTIGSQDISGVKTFIQTDTTTKLNIKDVRKTNGSAPASELQTDIVMKDTNGTPIGALRQAMFPNGSVRMGLLGFRGTDNFALNIQIDSAGTVTVFAEKTVGGVYTTAPIANW